MWKLILFVLPLGLDTFAVSAAIGLQGVSRRARWRISVLMSSFEMAMPVVGLGVGRGLGSLIGDAADWAAVAILLALGLFMLVENGDHESGERLAGLAEGRGLAMVALGISISLDEFAIGFTIGLLHLVIWVAILLIGAQAFAVAQAGLLLGSRLNRAAGEAAEKLAGVALIALALLFSIEAGC